MAIQRKRQYKRITPTVIANHRAAEVLHGNATAAVRETEYSHEDTDASDGSIRQRAYRIVAKRDEETTADYIESQLQQTGAEAVQRVAEMVQSRDERIALKSATYVIDHIRGKAVTRSISVTGKLNIQSVLD